MRRRLAGLMAFSCFFLFAQCALANTFLQGRVEEIFNNPNVTLPVALRATQLSLPIPSSQPHYLQAGLKSFPVILKGEWKGNLRVTKYTCSPIYERAQPADAQREQGIMTVGKPAESSFRFYTPSAGLVTMAPPEVKIALVGAPQGDSDYAYIAIQDFNSNRYLSASGTNRARMGLVKNEVKMLSTNVVEQDMVIEKVLIDRLGRQTKTYAEQVYRFTKSRPFELSVQVAEVDYGGDGRWWSKLLLEGDVH
jgi:hypothetical protein